MNRAAYSAFGSTEPVHDAGGDRVRWFCPWLIRDTESLARALDTLAQAGETHGASRLTARLVTRGEIGARGMALLAERGFGVEARLNIGGSADSVMIYVAANSAWRRTAPQDLERENRLLGAIRSEPPRGASAFIAGFHHQGRFRAERVGPGNLGGGDIDRLVTLHKQAFPTFPYDFDTKLRLMLESPESYLMMLVRSVSNGQVYAFSNLELNAVRLAGAGRLLLAEYDNSMRFEECEELGILGGLVGVLRVQLARLARRRGVDLCHSESRAGQAAINSISHHMGMRYGGRLEQHLLISGQSDVDYGSPSRFESMNAWFLDRDALECIEADCAQWPLD